MGLLSLIWLPVLSRRPFSADSAKHLELLGFPSGGCIRYGGSFVSLFLPEMGAALAGVGCVGG